MNVLHRAKLSFLKASLGKILSLWAVALLTHCSDVQAPVSDDQLAFELLNAGRYSEAAAVLERQIQANPQNAPARLRLASAYAGEIGFNLIEAFSAFEPLITFDPKAERVPKPRTETDDSASKPAPATPGVSTRDATQEERQKIKAFERNLLLTILDSEMVTRILFSLPYLGGDGRSKIARSIAVLREIPEDSSSYRVGLVYEAILQFLLFSNYTRDSFLGVANSPDQPTYPLKIYCGLDLREFLQNLPRSLQHLRAGLVALNQAGTNKETRFFKNVSQSLKAIDGLNNTYQEDTNLFTLAEIGNRGLKEDVCE